MLSKKLLPILKIWENSNKKLQDLKEEFNLKEYEVKKLQEYIKETDRVSNKMKFLRGEK